MNYKDELIQISGNQIKFRNTSLIIILIVGSGIAAFSFFGSPFSTLGAVLALLITFGLFIPIYWKNTISLSDISKVRVSVWDGSMDKNRNFWGKASYPYYFPTVFDEKSKPKVLLVERKDKKLAIGFTPERCNEMLLAFKERGITVIGETL